MTKRAVIVLYEDQSAQPKSFPLHDLVLACVVDRALSDGADETLARATVKRVVEGRPLKGNGAVVREMRSTPRIAPNGRQIIAVLDADKRVRVYQEAGAKDDDELVRSCKEPSKVTLLWIEQNTESVVHALLTAGLPISMETRRDAVSRKLPIARDTVFGRALAQGHRGVRSSLLTTMPSFNAIVDEVAKHVATRFHDFPGLHPHLDPTRLTSTAAGPTP